MRIGITGASGLVGRHLTAEALRHDHEVIAYSRNPDRSIEGATEVRDFSNPAEAVVSGLDVLIHLAGESILGLWTETKKQRIRDSRVQGTQQLVRAIEHCRPDERPKTLITASATGFYGDNGDDVLDEDSDPGFGFLADVVREWEAAAEEAKGVGLRVVCGRIGMILSPDGGAAPLLRKVFGLGVGGKLGSGKQWMPWVHIDDVARMFLRCATDENLSGPVNFVSPHPVRNRDFTKAVGEELHRPTVLPAPGFVIKKMLGGMHEVFLFSQRVEPATLHLEEFEWRYPHLEAALADALKDPETGEETEATSSGEPDGTVVDLGKSESA